MPGFIPVPDCAEVIFLGEENGHAAYITLGIKRTTPFLVPGDFEPLLDALELWWDEELSNEVTTSWNMPAIKVTSLESSTAPTVTRVGITPATGVVSAVPVPDNVALVVTFTTDLRGRSYRGRNYVPAVSNADLLNTSLWSVSQAADMGAAYQTLPTYLDPIDCTHVVISRQHDNVVLSEGVATPVTGYTGQRKLGTMRRRILGTGS